MHKLKSWPEAFNSVRDGSKRYEVRRDDRNFQVGDRVELLEFIPKSQGMAYDGTGKYTGRWWIGEVTHITRGGAFGLPNYLCVLGLAYRKRGES